MKKPEEIKKGLEYLSTKDVVKKMDLWKEGIAYDYAEDAAADAIAYIQQLEKMLHESFGRNKPFMEAAYGLAEKYERAMENAKILSDAVTQLEAEKNQLLEDLADHCGSKTLCKKYEDGTCPHEYDCTLYLSTCEDYEWRGLPEV